ncbi:MAG: 4a-hydroxytetrahydrobiopterin dehydratase [Acidimicrobiales bacterium]|jgi:4a-hydroxytetrahydrobiopterin dehydratase
MKKTQKVLTQKEIQKIIKKFDDWNIDTKKTKFTRTVTFDKHIDALIFIARVTVNAEILNHHPDVTFTYQRVKLVTTTHEVKGLTKLDVSLMDRVEHIASSQKVDKD